MIQSDSRRTQDRIRRLQEYVRANLLTETGNFICGCYDQCRASRPRPNAFYEGQMSYVGEHYDLVVNGSDLRIVVVGQEYGQSRTRVDLSARTEMIEESGGLPFSKRNPHMQGTTSILRLLLGRPAGRDREGEELSEDRSPPGHIFDGFALVNFLLCSALWQVPEGNRAGRGNSSPLMRRSCVGHFLRTLEILQPTVIVVEGKGVRRWMQTTGLARSLHIPSLGPDAIEEARIGGRRVHLLTFCHPSAGGRCGFWGRSPDSRYLREVVEPTISDWRSAAAIRRSESRPPVDCRPG